MRTDLITAALTANEVHHRYGHTCEDGRWWNPNTGTNTPCPPLALLRLAQTQLGAVRTTVHAAAHNDDHALVVGVAAAGYEDVDLNEVDDESRAGFLAMGRRAIEALSHRLDTDPDTEARAQAVLGRLTGSGAFPRQ